MAPLFFLSFIIGIFLGSFYNVLIDRLSTDRPVSRGRSYCESCKKTLTWYELVPLLSFLLQKGRCRNCKTQIPLRLFVVELLTGIVFGGVWWYCVDATLPISLLFYLLIIFSSCIVIFFADLEYGIIPDQMVIVMVLTSSAYLLFYSTPTLLNHFLTACGYFLFFLTLFLATKMKGVGFGDVKLAFALGLFLGFPAILSSFYGTFLTGAFVSLILILWGKKKLRGSTVPFGPFMIASSVVSYFYAIPILHFLLPGFF